MYLIDAKLPLMESFSITNGKDFSHLTATLKLR